MVELDGSLLWGRHTARRLPPASLTKLMTVLLATEQSAPESVVKVSKAAAQESGARLGLEAGAKFRARDLLAATLIGSANDACHALADHMAGSEKEFVSLMNRRAQALGMRGTHFVNACGHDANNHYSTADDLALLAHAVQKVPLLAELAGKAEMQIASLDSARSYRLTNHNALIGRYPGALGLKSGYTPQAGKCLVALARRDGRQVLLVLLNAANRWWDASALLDLAFEQARNGS